MNLLCHPEALEIIREGWDKSSYEAGMNYVFPNFIGGCVAIGQVLVYPILIGHNEIKPEVLLIPAAANALSLLYEGGRYAVKKGAEIKEELRQEYKAQNPS